MPADLLGIQALHEQIFTKRWDLAFWQKAAADESQMLLVHNNGSDLVGFALLRLVLDEAELITIGVAPTHRGQGIAAAMLEHMIQDARAGGVGTIFLEVARDNQPAIALYKKAGFTAHGQRRDYYAVGKDAVMMRILLSGSHQ